MYRRLTYRAPSRETVRTENGFASCRWTLSGVISAVLDGAWFGDEGQHDFETGIGAFAREAQSVMDELSGGRYAN